MVPYFGLINSPTGAKIFSCENGIFKPNLHKTDKGYSVKNYFVGFARKFYPTLIYKQIKFSIVFANFKPAKIISFLNKIFQYTSLSQYWKFQTHPTVCILYILFYNYSQTAILSNMANDSVGGHKTNMPTGIKRIKVLKYIFTLVLVTDDRKFLNVILTSSCSRVKHWIITFWAAAPIGDEVL